jgi:polysaccharide biosynthesis transport protein
MSETAVPTNAVSKLVKICLQWWWVWIGTTVTFGAIGFCYVTIIKNDVWVASQGLIVRDEANGAVMRLGRFQSQAEMKAAQETIIELARNPHVLNKALTAIGPDPSKIDDGSPWPSTKDVEETAKNVMVRAPRGAELGTTEVIYLDAKHGSRKRAYELNVAICDALEDRLQEVRRSRADGVFAELTTACETAEKELALATEKLHQMEKEAAADLSDLRGMTDTGTNTNSSRIQLDAVKNELHQAEVKLREMALELELADQVLANPNHLLGPNSIVNARPGLKKLHDGLTDARINGAQLRAKFTGVHPLVSAAEKAEREIESRLREEFTQARQALIKDIALSQRRVDDLKLQQSQLEARLANIANIRAEYGNLSNDVRSRSQIFQDAQRQLSEVRAAREAASSCSLVTRIDDPLASETPVGPGRSTIFAGTTIAGLFFGLGTVFLLTPFDGGVGYGRRRSDFETSMGRRMSDRSGAGTRQSDTPATTDSTAQSLSISDTDHTDAKSLVHAAKTITKKPTIDDSPSNSMASEYAEPGDADSLKAKRPLPTKPRHK